MAHFVAPPRLREMPTDIYLALVDSLYGDSRTLFIGSVAAAATALIVAVRSGEPLLVLITAAIVAVAVARAGDMRAYAKARGGIATVADGRRWENRYVIGAGAHVALLGLACLLAFVVTDDPFVQLFSFTLTIAYMIGISGRNFASDRLVKAQILCAGLPMMAALLWAGGVYNFIFVFVLLPFFLSLRLISTRLRHILLDAVITARENTFLAEHLETALNNMPHGLAMASPDRRIMVSNRRLADMLGVPPEAAGKGESVGELFARSVAGGALAAPGSGWAGDRIAAWSAGEEGRLEVETADGRSLALRHQPMENGGSVFLVEDETERRRAESKIRRLANFDLVTGLPNRNALQALLRSVLAAGSSVGCAVHFVDLDHFKQVNDTLGHARGDQLLRMVAERLRTLAGEPSVVTRFGGDEFIVLQPGSDGLRGAAAQLAEQIAANLAEPYEVDGHKVVIGASVGIALAPENGSDPGILLKNADMALYAVKAEERGRWQFFEPEMGERALDRRMLELDLRSALGRGELELHYQPQYNLRAQTYTSCEALLRWRHPERGMVSPADFIPIAEETGLIVEIGDWALRRACRDCLGWPAGMRVSVNISPVQFRRGALVARIRQALRETGLPADRLEVEITESVLLEDVEATRIALRQLRDMGVRIALDDFGTGYSSLSYLARFPLHKVKIDQSFLRGFGAGGPTLVLLRGIARLSADLGLEVAVEGVETAEQLDFVSLIGSVDEVQGFLFSKAVPVAELAKRLGSAVGPKAQVA